MSRTIDIIPTEIIDLTFEKVIYFSERNINKFLSYFGIDQPIRLKINLIRSDNSIKEIQLVDSFSWNENEYILFTISGIKGGIDGYCQRLYDKNIDPKNPWWWLEIIRNSNKKIKDIDELIEKSKALNRKWSLRCSTGQPGIIAVSYGLISAAIAELSHGILWSDDGAWSNERFPTEYQDFLSWYLNRERPTDIDEEFLVRCIEEIKIDFTAPNKDL